MPHRNRLCSSKVCAEMVMTTAPNSMPGSQCYKRELLALLIAVFRIKCKWNSVSAHSAGVPDLKQVMLSFSPNENQGCRRARLVLFNTLSKDHADDAAVGVFYCHYIRPAGIRPLYYVSARRKSLIVQDEWKGHVY